MTGMQGNLEHVREGPMWGLHIDNCTVVHYYVSIWDVGCGNYSMLLSKLWLVHYIDSNAVAC